MTRAPLVSIFLATGSLLVLAACVGGGGGPANDYTTACMFEVNPPGSYVWSDGDSGVTPGGGGTAEGAAALNDCIRRKAAADGMAVTAGATERSEVVRTGNTVTQTYSYGTPPAAATARAAPAATGQNCRSRNVMSGGTGYAGGCS
jgi:hypothetical protein